jgi:mannose-6-phosphate isomerase
VILAPSRFDPVFVFRIWGARSLAPLFADRTNLSEPIGEVWLTGNKCKFASGPFTGQTLASAWAQMPCEWTGTRVDPRAPFPLLTKFIFPAEKLSIQVHPDDDYARAHETATGCSGKTEMWYVVAAAPKSEVLVGLLPEVTRNSFAQAIADGTAENCLHRIPVRAGDVIFVPAGTVHTIGPGLVLCEIQENSDLTYRVFDYNRVDASGQPRPLHVEKALQVARFGPQLGGKIVPLHVAEMGIAETFCLACRYFAVEIIAFSARIECTTSPERFELYVVLAGNGRIEWGAAYDRFSTGDAWLLPAALGRFLLAPDGAATLLRAFVPDLEKDCLARYRARGIPESEYSRVLFR